MVADVETRPFLLPVLQRRAIQQVVLDGASFYTAKSVKRLDHAEMNICQFFCLCIFAQHCHAPPFRSEGYCKTLGQHRTIPALRLKHAVLYIFGVRAILRIAERLSGAKGRLMTMLMLACYISNTFGTMYMIRYSMMNSAKNIISPFFVVRFSFFFFIFFPCWYCNTKCCVLQHF